MPTGNGATDVMGAAHQLSALLTEQVPTEEPKQEEQEAQAEEPEVVTDETEEAAETPEGDTEAEEAAYKVKYRGEEREFTQAELERELEELHKGNLRDADYRKKTMELADQRKATESKNAELDQKLLDAKSILDDERETLESEEMKQLKEYDPEAYIKQYDKVQAKLKKFEKLKAQQAERQQAQHQEQVEKEREALFSAFPHWSEDKQAMSKEFGELMTGLKSFGYSEEELGNLVDHRMFVIASKLQELDRLTKQDLESKKVKTKPKHVKPGAPKSKQERQVQGDKNLRQKLAQTGSMHDAIRLLSSQ